MKLIIFGEEHNSQEEIEIFSTKPFDDFEPQKNSYIVEAEYGFDVKIVTKDDHPRLIEGFKKVMLLNNVTEYHHLWELEMGGRLACESDIHNSGYVPWEIFERYELVEVTKSKKLYPQLHNKNKLLWN